MSAPTAWVGQAIKRKEDPRLIMGRARYIDDINVTGQLWASFVRSPEAHAKITSIDTSDAKAFPGVHAVFTGNDLDPVQQAFVDAGAVQCGFCTPGLILATHDLLNRSPDPEDGEIREALAGNLCRCTGYEKILDAVRIAARAR